MKKINEHKELHYKIEKLLSEYYTDINLKEKINIFIESLEDFNQLNDYQEIRQWLIRSSHGFWRSFQMHSQY